MILFTVLLCLLSRSLTLPAVARTLPMACDELVEVLEFAAVSVDVTVDDVVVVDLEPPPLPDFRCFVDAV